MSDNILFQYLDWDSNFFGVRIARINSNRLIEETLKEANSWCAANKIDCLYLLADTDDDMTVLQAESGNFHLVDLRMTFQKQIADSDNVPTNDNRIRLCKSQDIEELRLIARKNHSDTRFYFDRHFSHELCDELYATWIERSCENFADAVFVVDHDGEAGGYISCHLREGNVGQIGLVGVGPTLQGKGIGTLLVGHAVNWFATQGMRKVTVVTQGRNVAAQRLYQKRGFLTQSVQLWYHKWYNK